MKTLLPKKCSGTLSGIAILKWLVVLAFVALAGWAGFSYLSEERSRSELEQLRAQTEQLQKEKQDLEQRQAEKDAKPAEDNSLELAKLRGEVVKYRAMEKQYQALQTENQQLRANLAQLQQASAETATIRSQNVQMQGMLQDRAFGEQCLANLRAIAGAKAQWALENKKAAYDVPTDIDLFGRYMPQKPVCPKGGVYTLGPVQAKPTCTIAGHNY